MSDKKDKSIVEVLIDVVVDHTTKDLQKIIDKLSDDPESEGDNNE